MLEDFRSVGQAFFSKTPLKGQPPHISYSNRSSKRTAARRNTAVRRRGISQTRSKTDKRSEKTCDKSHFSKALIRQYPEIPPATQPKESPKPSKYNATVTHVIPCVAIPTRRDRTVPFYPSAFTSFTNDSPLKYARTLSKVVVAIFVSASRVKNA